MLWNRRIRCISVGCLLLLVFYCLYWELCIFAYSSTILYIWTYPRVKDTCFKRYIENTDWFDLRHKYYHVWQVGLGHLHIVPYVYLGRFSQTQTFRIQSTMTYLATYFAYSMLKTALFLMNLFLLLLWINNRCRSRPVCTTCGLGVQWLIDFPP